MSDNDYFYEDDGIYCYPGTNVLKNKLGIRDSEEFSRAETTITILRMVELDSNPVNGNFDFEHLREIHRRIFGDIFEWAGEVRTVQIAKGRTEFCRCEYIQENADRLFSELARDNMLRDMDEETIIPKLAYYLGEINAIHPFREGNGRTQRKFIEHLAKQAGHPLNFRDISKDEMTYASVYSMLRDDSKMCAVIRKCIVEYDRSKPESLSPFTIGLEPVFQSDNVCIHINRRHNIIVVSHSIFSQSISGRTSSIEANVDELLQKAKEVATGETGEHFRKENRLESEASCYAQLTLDLETYINQSSEHYSQILSGYDFKEFGVTAFVIFESPAGLGDTTYGGAEIYYQKSNAIDKTLFYDDVTFIGPENE